MNSVRWLTLILGSILAFQAHGDESLIGKYRGILSDVKGYKVTDGKPCSVTIGTSERFGGSLVFEIDNIDELIMASRKVKKALKRRSPFVKLHTPGDPGKSADVVVFERANNGEMKSLKLKRIWNERISNQSVTCSSLIKK